MTGRDPFGSAQGKPSLRPKSGYVRMTLRSQYGFLTFELLAMASSLFVNGMQKHGLTMFAATCYSSLVPRVHPGLLCAVSFAAV